jgi:hypothetical protein
MDPDSDPSTFVTDPQDANKNLIYFLKFFCLILLEGIFTSFFKDKVKKTVGNRGFSYYFGLMIEES